MQKLDSTTFDAASTEQVTFSVGNTTQVSGVSASVDGGPGGLLPITVTGDHLITIAVGFIGSSGGSADIQIVGSLGGSDTDRIAQIPGLPFRNRTYRT